MYAFRRQFQLIRPRLGTIAGLFAAATIWASIGWTSIGYGQSSAKGAVESFADSPVDAITVRIRADLKTIKLAAPGDTPAKPLPDKGPPSGNPATGSSKTPISPKSISSPRVRVAETNAQKCQTAEEALLLVKIFMADPELTDEEKEQAQARLDFWEQAATDQLVRVGTKWMLKPDAEKLRQEADNLVDEALEMINANNFSAAHTKLEKAVKIYPEHLGSTFQLAVGAYLGNEFKAAELKFTQCLDRLPNNLALLNNVALCEIHLRQHAAAVKHWEQAIAIDPENDNVAQNLGTFISDANLKKFGSVDRGALSDATDAYEKMLEKDSRLRAKPARSYAVIRKLHDKPDDPAAVEESRAVGTGTGFVIAPGYVLTNRHLVDETQAVVVQDPAKPNGLPLAAKVVATSKELDLALIECPQLKAPAVPVSTVPVSRDAEVMAIGFPKGLVAGKGRKATRGTVTGVPSEDTDKMMVLDVELPPGTSGGPLCDETGRVVGVVSAKTVAAVLGQQFGQAVPMKDVMPFLKQHITDFAPPKPDANTMDWTDIDALISQSTVMVIVQKKH